MKTLALSLIALALVAATPKVARADISNQDGSTTAQKKKQKIDMKKDFSSLGDNQAVVDRAKMLDPQNKYKVVQSRAVDRHMRLELGLNGGLIAGGDAYYNTTTLGANLDFHISPYWSVGARYYHSYNSLTSEGQNVYQNHQNNPTTTTVPGGDYPTDTTLGVVTWYPVYGKLNLFDMGVSHFDVYFLGGYGKTSLTSGLSDTYTAGGGLGFWWTNWLASRLEARYQTYTDHPYTDNAATIASSSRQINEVIFMGSIGFLL